MFLTDVIIIVECFCKINFTVAKLNLPRAYKWHVTDFIK